LKSQEGRLFFGGVNGLTSFHPDSVRDNLRLPPVVLTDFQLFNKPVDIGGSEIQYHITEVPEIRLRYDQSVISFAFAALNYRSPEKNQYAYMMEPFDNEWQYVGAKRTATYTNLDPGAYTFRVKASNNSGVWNEEGVAVKIVVTPPFWGTWWFRSLSIVAVVMMLIAVYQLRTRRIRSRNRALHVEIRERQRVEAELATNNAELEQKNVELERFTYTVSHDLKAPLVTIKGFLGLLQQDADAGNIDQMKSDMDRISGAADKMARLLAELLELSRIGRLMNPPLAVALTDLAREAVQLVTGPIVENGVAVEIDEAMPVVYGDRVRLLEVYQNLIDNAVKFMGRQPEPCIEVGVRQDEGEVVCFVRDNGLGIDPHYHEKVFGLFERLDVTSGGTGIGLALVKRIVEVHGGRIWVESDGEGQGSTFFFTLETKTGADDEAR